MRFNPRAYREHWRSVYIGHHLHSVWIAHGQHGNLSFIKILRQCICYRLYSCLSSRYLDYLPFLPNILLYGLCVRLVKRNGGQIKHGGPHIDCDAAIGLFGQGQNVVHRFDANRRFVSQATLAHIAHKAARAVAAVLYLAAVGVVDDVFKIHAAVRRRPHGQNLVCTHAKMPVAQVAVLRCAKI